MKTFFALLFLLPQIAAVGVTVPAPSCTLVAESANPLYPEIEPYDKGHLQIGIHKIYYEQSGNPNGYPVIGYHGGPGGKTSPLMRRYFDPGFFRIILVDQPGCGESTPLGELRENTTEHVLNVFEQVRLALGIKEWMPYGGSWGSTLAILDMARNPGRVRHAVLRGIYQGSKWENHWYLSKDGVGLFYPEEWERFISLFSKKEQKNIGKAYFDRLGSRDRDKQLEAQYHWHRFMTTMMELKPDYEKLPHPTDDAVLKSRMELHYVLNDMFLEKRAVLNAVSRLAGVKATLIHGRYDMTCPPRTAYEVAERWPGGAELIFVYDAAHAVGALPLAAEIVKATNRVRDELRQAPKQP